MEPEYSKEELSKRVKDFNEEIPPKANIGGQVRDEQLETICRRDEGVKVTNQQSGYPKQSCNACKEDCEVSQSERCDPGRRLSLLSLLVVA